MKKFLMVLVLAAVAAPIFAQTAGADPFRHPRRWVCFARNHRGAQFEGVAFERIVAEREALRGCERFSGSRFCRIETCSERF